MNIPNIITLFRLILVPIYFIVFFSKMDNRIIVSGIIFFIAGISDVLDGYIARKYNQTSKLGAALDPFADKLMSFAVLFSFTLDKIIPKWVLIVLIIKEGLMIIGGLTLYFKKNRSVIPSNKFGKLATVFFYLFVFTIVFKFSIKISTITMAAMIFMNILAFISYLNLYMNIRKGDNANKVDK